MENQDNLIPRWYFIGVLFVLGLCVATPAFMLGRYGPIKKSNVSCTDSVWSVSKVHVTVYNPVASQTSNNGLITSCGDTIKVGQGLKWAAISPDLYGVLDCGDNVIIICHNTRYHLKIFKITDKTNKRIKNTIDILEDTISDGKFVDCRIIKLPKK